jgi:hypothetical protein
MLAGCSYAQALIDREVAILELAEEVRGVELQENAELSSIALHEVKFIHALPYLL